MTDSLIAMGEFAPEHTFSTQDGEAFQPDLGATAHLASEASAVSDDAQAVVVEPNGFLTLDLAPELVKACMDLGYTQPTPVQTKVIPLALPTEGADKGAKKYIDLMVSSQTGSGKTAAFLLPVLHTLLKQMAQAEADERQAYEEAVAQAAAKGEAPPKRPKRKDPTNARNFKAPTPGALIVCPTRELAQQVAHDAIDLVQHCRGLRVANIVGGMPYQLQIAKLQNANLVVATPGRLLDLQRSMQIKLDQVQFLVVDEADRMLDLGFSDDLAEINQLTIDRKQTMMFSATFAPRIMQLATRVMRQPQRVEIDSPHEKHASITQALHWADNMTHKRKLLDHLLRDTTINQAIVFACTQVECDGLANDLVQDGFSAVALHGALGQGLRNRRLMAFRDGRVQVLVATDVAARGLDVPTITHVINYGLPMKAEDYVHRIGRTGRAGREGNAITIAEFRDRRKIQDIEHYSQQNLKASVIAGLEPQQRFAPTSDRPRGNFGGRDDRGSPRGNFGGGGGGFAGRKPAGGGFNAGGGDRNFGGDRGGNFQGRPAPQGGYADRSGFNDRGPRRDDNGGNFAPQEQRSFAPREDRNFAPRQERSFAPRNDSFAPRGDGFASRGEGFAPKPAFAKPAFAKPAGKVFVPRDAAKKAAKFSKARD